MNNRPTLDWDEANQRYLTAAVTELRELLTGLVGDPKDRTPPAAPPKEKGMERSEDLADDMQQPPALESLCRIFGLSPFERQILLLCASIELDSAFPALCALAHGDPGRTAPTFSLAFGVFPDAHWSVLSPARPLRHWRLIEPGAGESLTQSPLRIDERVLNYLTGVHHLDERLAAYVKPVRVSDNLVPSQQTLADHLAETWSAVEAGSRLPVVQLCGKDAGGLKAIAAVACEQLGLGLFSISAHALPLEHRDLDGFIRLWEREAALSASALLLDCSDIDPAESVRSRTIVDFIEHTHAPFIVATRDSIPVRDRFQLVLEAPGPTAMEQRKLWEAALGKAVESLNGELDSLVSHFSMNPENIRSASAEALARFGLDSVAGHRSRGDLASSLWNACRKQSRPQLSNMAQRVQTTARWDDLILPIGRKRVLQEIALHVRHRMKVYESWGFAAKSSRSLGISALFSGPSGTGKTLAAEVLANELRLDLYRIDLSQVVSKYIGETEKNLRHVFDAADAGAAILLFDEADALFGKRSEVKDSHDRYANIEIGYLLQRMEAYRGLAILTTNMKDAIDQSFLRRIRFIVRFPFPDAEQRAEIWRTIFPSDTPTDGLDVQKMARLTVAGGNIRNIALNAAFLAADASEPVRMSHVLDAARLEYAKLERPLTDSEIGGWK